MNIFKKLFCKKEKVVHPPVVCGDVFVDDSWGDTKLEVVQLHPTKPLIRYKFLMIDGKPITQSGIHETSIWFLHQDYKRLPKI